PAIGLQLLQILPSGGGLHLRHPLSAIRGVAAEEILAAVNGAKFGIAGLRIQQHHVAIGATNDAILLMRKDIMQMPALAGGTHTQGMPIVALRRVGFRLTVVPGPAQIGTWSFLHHGLNPPPTKNGISPPPDGLCAPAR